MRLHDKCKNVIVALNVLNLLLYGISIISIVLHNEYIAFGLHSAGALNVLIGSLLLCYYSRGVFKQFAERKTAVQNFSQLISYDIKTPINILYLTTERLLECGGDNSNLLRNQIYTIIVLQNMVDNVIVYEKTINAIDDIRPAFKTFDVKKLVERVKQMMELYYNSDLTIELTYIDTDHIHHSRNLNEIVYDELYCTCDEKYVQQIIMNILHYACKCLKNGKIKLTVGNLMVRRSKFLRIECTLHGSIIHSLAHIMLSDAIVQVTNNKLIELLRGTHGMNDRTYWVQIPCNYEETEVQDNSLLNRITRSNSRSDEDSIGSEKMCIVADDARLNVFVLSQAMRKFGFKAISASNGEDLQRQFAERTDCTIALVDIHMPLCSGIEATKAIRAKEYGKNVIIVGITGDISGQTATEALRAGMDHILIKPVTEEQIKTVLERYKLLN